MKTVPNPRASVSLFIALIGEDATANLLETKGIGGCSFEFPKGQTSRGDKAVQVLHDAVGIEAAKKLIKHFGGDRIYIPKGTVINRHRRNRRIVEAYNSGTPVNQLAGDFDLTGRQIWTILKNTDMSAGPAATLKTIGKNTPKLQHFANKAV